MEKIYSKVDGRLLHIVNRIYEFHGRNGLIPDDKNVGDVNIPARDAWTEDNQQLNKTKVSTVDGDKDVAGVFWTWDDADDEYVNDYYIAMVHVHTDGRFSIALMS